MRLAECMKCDAPIRGQGLQRLCAECINEWRWCNKCKRIREIDAFRMPGGKLLRYCYDCLLLGNKKRYATKQEVRDFHYKHHLRRTLGITGEQADHFAAQRVCEICGTSARPGKRLSVDHNHGTGQVRGAICQRCNLAVRVLEADPEWVAQIEAYLARYGLLACG